MSEISPGPDADKPVVASRGRGLRIALAVSVALNLAVLGMVAGAMLHGGGMGGGRDGVRELGFGPFTEALSREDRANLRQQFFARAPEFRETRRAMRQDNEALIAALRAEPFDAEKLGGLMSAQQERMIGQLQLGQGLMRDLLLAMSPEARLAFADRLEARLHHGGPDDGKEPPPAP